MTTHEAPLAPRAAPPLPAGPYWIWPLRIPAAQRRLIARWSTAGASLTSGYRWLGLAAAAGVLPLLLAYPFGWSGHRFVSALLLFPLFVALVRADRQREGFALVLASYACHSIAAISLTWLDAAGAAPLLADGPAYWEKNYRWIRTGTDPEYQVINWLPAHLQQLAGMAIYGFTSLGLIPLAQGMYEIDLMNFYVGRLLRLSDNPFVALFVGWHFWAILRGVAYTRIVFEVSSLSLSRMTGIELSTRPRRRRRWLVGLACLSLDGLGKLLALEPVRLVLYAHLIL